MGRLFHCSPGLDLSLGVVMYIQAWAVLSSFQGMEANTIGLTPKLPLMSEKEIQEEGKQIWDSFNPFKPLTEIWDSIQAFDNKGKELKKTAPYRIHGADLVSKGEEEKQTKDTSPPTDKTDEPPRKTDVQVPTENGKDLGQGNRHEKVKEDEPITTEEIRVLKPNGDERETGNQLQTDRTDDPPAVETILLNEDDTDHTESPELREAKVGADKTTILKVLNIGDSHKKGRGKPEPHSVGDATGFSGMTSNKDGDDYEDAPTVNVITDESENQGNVRIIKPEEDEGGTRKTQVDKNNVNQEARLPERLERSFNDEELGVEKQQGMNIENKVQSSNNMKRETGEEDELISDDKTPENVDKKFRQKRNVRREANNEKDKEKGLHEQTNHKQKEEVKGEGLKKKEGEEEKKKEYKVYVEKDKKKKEDSTDDKGLEVAGLGYIMFKEKEKGDEKDASSDVSGKDSDGDDKKKPNDHKRLTHGLRCDEDTGRDGHKKHSGGKHHKHHGRKEHKSKGDLPEAPEKDTPEETKKGPKHLSAHVSEELYEVTALESEGNRRSVRTHGYNHSMSNAAIHILVVIGICLFGFTLIIFVFARARSNTGRVTRVNSQTALYEPHTKYDKYEKMEY